MARFEFSGLFVIILKRSTFEGKWGLRLVWSILSPMLYGGGTFFEFAWM